MKTVIILLCIILSYQDIKSLTIYSPLNCILLICSLLTDYYTIIFKVLGIIVIPLLLVIINNIYEEIIGYGDIEFISAVGGIIGIYDLNIMLLISSFIALVYILITRKKVIPLIPFLSIGLIIILLF